MLNEYLAHHRWTNSSLAVRDVWGLNFTQLLPLPPFSSHSHCRSPCGVSREPFLRRCFYTHRFASSLTLVILDNVFIINRVRMVADTKQVTNNISHLIRGNVTDHWGEPESGSKIEMSTFLETSNPGTCSWCHECLVLWHHPVCGGTGTSRPKHWRLQKQGGICVCNPWGPSGG